MGGQVGAFDFETVTDKIASGKTYGEDRLKALRWIGPKLRSPEGLALHGDNIFVSEGPKDRLVVISLASGELIHTINHLHNPRGLAIVEDRFLAVAERNDNCVLLLGLDDLQPVRRIPSKDACAPNEDRL